MLHKIILANYLTTLSKFCEKHLGCGIFILRHRRSTKIGRTRWFKNNFLKIFRSRRGVKSSLKDAQYPGRSPGVIFMHVAHRNRKLFFAKGRPMRITTRKLQLLIIFFSPIIQILYFANFMTRTLAKNNFRFWWAMCFKIIQSIHLDIARLLSYFYASATPEYFQKIIFDYV